MKAAARTGSTRLAAVATAAVLAAVTVGCGHSSSSSGGGKSSGSASPSGAASAKTTAAGDFGTLKAICGPGTPSGPTGRGITNTEIRIGVLADPGNTAAPGLEQEFFDAADAFSKWCNAAGGINGRKIVIDKWDAKLFNVGQAMTNACQKDFMLVGGGNALDEPGVKPRLACKLAQIPGYDVSVAAANAGLQVKAAPSDPTQFGYGPLRLLINAYPDSKNGIRRRQQQPGLAGTDRQAGRGGVDGQRRQGHGDPGEAGVGGQLPALHGTAQEHRHHRPLRVRRPEHRPGDPGDEGHQLEPSVHRVTRRSSTHRRPSRPPSLWAPIPPTYVGLSHLPFELSGQFPVLAQIKQQLDCGGRQSTVHRVHR